MLLPLASQQCFFSALFVFIVLGFLRGWRREVISLVCVLLAVCLIHPDTSDALNCFLGRSGSVVAYVSGSSPLPFSSCYSAISFLRGAYWSLVIFVLLVALGYCIGDRICPEPACVLDRFFGVIPAIISGTVVLFYLCFYVKVIGEPTNLQVNVQEQNPGSFVPVIFVMVIITLVVALLVSCSNKYCKK